MTVRELRDLLRVFPETAEVVLQGDGSWDPVPVEQVSRACVMTTRGGGHASIVGEDYAPRPTESVSDVVVVLGG